MQRWRTCLPQADFFSPTPAHLTEWAPEQWPVAQDWRPVIDVFLKSPEGAKLGQFLQTRLASGAIIYPPQPFLALQLTALAQVKVVILGQDPYHGKGQAQGLAFSVPPGERPPPSLRNILKEIARDPDLHSCAPRSASDGSLVHWATQGVLLLNTCLTVEDGKPASHAKRGWEHLTDAIVRTIAEKNKAVVFLLWGAHAQAKKSLFLNSGDSVDKPMHTHLILNANHPSPLSALRPPTPFLGCSHFSQTNTFLEAKGQAPIDWT